MQLTQGQEYALRAVEEMRKSHPEGGGICVISGYAGTGKTTILRMLAEETSLMVLAPTGKAAMRVKEVCPQANASTVHRWLYEVAEDPQTGKLLTTIKDVVQIPSNRTIFVDEASMVGFKMFKDLYFVCKQNKLNLCFVGDNFQLPPVESEEKYRDFSILSPQFPAHYKVHMTEVVRQALDSPIIRASMDVRDLRSDLSALGTLPSIPEAELVVQSARVFENGGATVCHRNATRHSLNTEIRQLLGYGEKVVKGEPLMVIFNNYDLDVFNGEIVTVLREPELVGTKPVPVTDRFVNETMNMWYYQTQIDTPIGRQITLFADREVFGVSGKISTKAIRSAGKQLSRHMMVEERKQHGPISYSELKTIEGLPVLNANLGYALTAHKSQGSEWGEVIVALEPSVRIHTVEGRRWVYTSLTRAKQKVSLCWL